MPAQTSHGDTLTIGRLSSLAQVDVATVRFYERSGLLEAQERTESGYRLYSRNSLARIQFILRARETGYSLDQIKDFLNLYDNGGSKQEIEPFITSMIADIDNKMHGLKKWRQLFTDISDYFEHSNATSVDREIVDTLMRGQCNKANH
jgi:DNA-binding transcriptional MerR regulator